MNTLKRQIERLLMEANGSSDLDGTNGDWLAAELQELYDQDAVTKGMVRANARGEVEVDNPSGAVKILKLDGKRWVLAASATRTGVVDSPDSIATVLVDP